MLLRRLCERLGLIPRERSQLEPCRESRMKAESWAASKSTRCSLLPMHQMWFRLQFDSTGEEVNWPRPLTV